MSRSVRYSVVFLFLLTLAAAGLNLAFTTAAVHRQEHEWCATLNLLTARPVSRPADPQANPSREQAWVLFSDFLDLRHQFGCG